MGLQRTMANPGERRRLYSRVSKYDVNQKMHIPRAVLDNSAEFPSGHIQAASI
jgi:hypothetical protein